MCLGNRIFKSSNLLGPGEGEKSVLDGERLRTPDVHGPSSCGQRTVWLGCVWAAPRDQRLGPFKALLPSTKPRASAEEDMHYCKRISIPIHSPAPPPVGGNHSLHNLSLCPPRQLLPSG